LSDSRGARGPLNARSDVRIWRDAVGFVMAIALHLCPHGDRLDAAELSPKNCFELSTGGSHLNHEVWCHQSKWLLWNDLWYSISLKSLLARDF
jgi:hypothetical protein